MTSDEFLIHPEHLSARPQILQGTLLPGELERLEGTLANGEGELRFRIAAVLDPHRRKVVSCTIEGFVFLTCQSTLEVFRHEVAVKDRLILVDRDSELPGIEEEAMRKITLSPMDRWTFATWSRTRSSSHCRWCHASRGWRE